VAIAEIGSLVPPVGTTNRIADNIQQIFRFWEGRRSSAVPQPKCLLTVVNTERISNLLS
jgi:hypothetical protein